MGFGVGLRKIKFIIADSIILFIHLHYNFLTNKKSLTIKTP